MDKELFKTIMRQLEENDTNTNIFCEALDRITGDKNFMISIYGNNDTTLYKILSYFYDDIVMDSISYFIYELDFGRNYTPGCITELDGTEIEVRTIDQLYDLCEETQRRIEAEKD